MHELWSRFEILIQGPQVERKLLQLLFQGIQLPEVGLVQIPELLLMYLGIQMLLTFAIRAFDK